jgi:dipeptidase D
MEQSNHPFPAPEAVMRIFRQLNQIPRPSHHEERVADFLCQFAEQRGLDYQRDEQHCVVIRKPATPGYEKAEPIVVLNHMDMVCVGMEDPLNDPIVAKIDGEWMRAEGTSLGADNGIGLSMALAMLDDDSIVHGPIEVITTTNEEDGMTGAAGLALDFIRGRKVINLDSEDYDTITTGAAGALLQQHRLPMEVIKAPGGKRRWYRITITGGKGGHSGVDINKGRASAVMMAWAVLSAIYNEFDLLLAAIDVGEANASIASSAQMIITVPSGEAAEFVKQQEDTFNEWIAEEYGETDPDVRCHVEKVNPCDTVISDDSFQRWMTCLEQLPQGVIKMSDDMPDTVETSNNVGRLYLDGDQLIVTTHTRSFNDDEKRAVAAEIAQAFTEAGGSSVTLMDAPAWREDQQAPFIKMTSDVFQDLLGWRPKMVAMHFVLEAGYFVEKYPGIQIASIGPRIVEPHSTSERVKLSTISDIWKVFVELLRRLAQQSLLS